MSTTVHEIDFQQCQPEADRPPLLQISPLPMAASAPGVPVPSCVAPDLGPGWSTTLRSRLHRLRETPIYRIRIPAHVSEGDGEGKFSEVARAPEGLPEGMRPEEVKNAWPFRRGSSSAHGGTSRGFQRVGRMTDGKYPNPMKEKLGQSDAVDRSLDSEVGR
jgi:hypothetical protein